MEEDCSGIIKVLRHYNYQVKVGFLSNRDQKKKKKFIFKFFAMYIFTGKDTVRESSFTLLFHDLNLDMKYLFV